MTTISKARAYLTAAPREAVGDAAGLAAICLTIFAGFTVPALF